MKKQDLGVSISDSELSTINGGFNRRAYRLGQEARHAFNAASTVIGIMSRFVK